MDHHRFDALTKTFSTTATRRGVARLLGSLPIIGGPVLRLMERSPEAVAAADTRGGDGINLASHGCRHGGARCRRGRQCCTGTCLRSGGKKRCSCDANNPCVQPDDPCRTAVCSSEGHCVTQNLCREASCTNRVETQAASCDSTGTCPAPVTRPCQEGYQCHATQPVCVGPGGCGGPDDCTNTHFCLGGLCQPKKANGQTCANGLQCLSGFCSADNICCSSACDAAGQTCPGGTCTG